MTFGYVASPYTTDDREQQAAWIDATMRYCRDSFLENEPVYSPIVHWEGIADIYNLPTDAAAWSVQNRAMLRAADVLIVLCLPGWENSKGIAMEIEWAKELEKDVIYVHSA